MSFASRLKFTGSALVLILASCAITEDKPAPIPLPEGQWELVSSSFTDIGRIPGIPRATLQFRQGQISAFSGCNTGAGSATSIDGKIVLSPLATTRRACAEPVGGFDGRFFKMLGSQPYFRIENGVLILAGGDHSMSFRRIPDAPAAARPYP